MMYPFNPYQNQLQNLQSQILSPAPSIQYVNGRQSADNYTMQPNSSVILMDSTMDRFYVKKSDASGSCTVDAYDFHKAADENMAEELKDAQDYIEKALWYKAKGDQTRYAKYKEMSAQELNHASMIHDMAVQDIAALDAVYPEIPLKMLEAWDKAHTEFVEKVAWIKQMHQA